MKMMTKYGGDDKHDYRLLSYLNQTLPIKIEKLVQIKKNVYRVKSENGLQFVLKGFLTRKRLKIQEVFTQLLKNSGFQKTYTFYSFSEEQNLYFNTHFYGCIELLEEGNSSFYYDCIENCQEGIELLQLFHQSSSLLVGTFQKILPHFNLIEKWEERLSIFKQNLPLISLFLEKNVIEELLSWAEWSLSGLKKEAFVLNAYPLIILHGDVAHHNFFRTADDKLYLIDFDLISIGPPVIDYLQYSNRILSFLNWSLNDLEKFKPLKNIIHEKVFLYGLGYPTDIFREWNRLIKEKNNYDTKKVRSVIKLTIGEIDKRREFYNKLLYRIKFHTN